MTQIIRSFCFCAANFWLNSLSCFFLVLLERFWYDHVCHRLRFSQAGAATWRRCSSEGVHWFGATLTGRIASRGAAAQADVDPNQRNPLIRSFCFCAANFWLNSLSCFFLVLLERFWYDHVCHRLRFSQAGAATWRRCSSEGVHWFGATLTGRIASRGAAAQADVDPNQRNPLIRSFGFCAAHFWLNSFSCFFLVLRERFVIVDENRRCGV